MIFQHTWEAVLAGSKTQTRRLVKPGEHYTSRVVDYGTELMRVCTNTRLLKWGLFNTYAVQPGRGKRAVGRIRITRIRRERLQDITEEDALAEGRIPSYRTEGLVIYDRPAISWGASVPLIYRTAREEYILLWNHIHTRKGERWEDNPPVWVLDFELVREPLALGEARGADIGD